MAAYVVVNVDIHNAERYEDYRKMVPATLAAYNGKFVVRGGEMTTLEGSWPRKRLVIVEFPDIESAKKWWASPEYAPAKALRQANSTADMIVIEGFEPK